MGICKTIQEKQKEFGKSEKQIGIRIYVQVFSFPFRKPENPMGNADSSRETMFPFGKS
jgi:hypothetical protein